MNASGPKAYTIRGGDSMPADITSPLPLAPLEDKTSLVDFDGGRLSSDGGLLLLNDPDEQLGLTRALAAVLRERRDPRRVTFTLHDLLKQHVFHIAAGYEDANDATPLRHDPIFKVRLGRLPASGAPLASQPTISRFENRVSRTDLYRLARVFVHHFLASYARPPTLVVLDFDDTEDPAHGEQEHIRYDGCARGQAANEIKDHKRYLKSDRPSWHRFAANPCRLFLHSAAYVLLDTFRREVLRGTPWARATMETIQLRLLKLGARVQEFTDRITLSLPSSCPVAPVLRRRLTLLACVRLT